MTYSILADLNNSYETTLQSIDPGLTLLTDGEYTEVVEESEAIYYYGRLVVPNEDGKLRIGMTTQNMIYVANADNVLSIPSIAIKKDAAGNQYVNILTINGPARKDITTGVSDGLNVEVKSGLEEGDDVIMTNMTSSEALDKLSNVRGRRRGF